MKIETVKTRRQDKTKTTHYGTRNIIDTPENNY